MKPESTAPVTSAIAPPAMPQPKPAIATGMPVRRNSGSASDEPPSGATNRSAAAIPAPDANEDRLSHRCPAFRAVRGARIMPRPNSHRPAATRAARRYLIT